MSVRQESAVHPENATAAAGVEDKLLVACPACHHLVRVPRERLADGPRCGRCKAEVLSGAPFALDATSFHAHVERGSLPVLVDFWAPWCGPCRMMAPVLDRLAARRRSSLQVAKINTDEQQALAGRFGIRSIPTLILFESGRELARQAGATDPATLDRWLDSTLAR
jgi:thioredoxin 2